MAPRGRVSDCAADKKTRRSPQPHPRLGKSAWKRAWSGRALVWHNKLSLGATPRKNLVRSRVPLRPSGELSFVLFCCSFVSLSLSRINLGTRNKHRNIKAGAGREVCHIRLCLYFRVRTAAAPQFRPGRSWEQQVHLALRRTLSGLTSHISHGYLRLGLGSAGREVLRGRLASKDIVLSAE